MAEDGCASDGTTLAWGATRGAPGGAEGGGQHLSQDLGNLIDDDVPPGQPDPATPEEIETPEDKETPFPDETGKGHAEDEAEVENGSDGKVKRSPPKAKQGARAPKAKRGAAKASPPTAKAAQKAAAQAGLSQRQQEKAGAKAAKKSEAASKAKGVSEAKASAKKAAARGQLAISGFATRVPPAAGACAAAPPAPPKAASRAPGQGKEGAASATPIARGPVAKGLTAGGAAMMLPANEIITREMFENCRKEQEDSEKMDEWGESAASQKSPPRFKVSAFAALSSPQRRKQKNTQQLSLDSREDLVLCEKCNQPCDPMDSVPTRMNKKGQMFRCSCCNTRTTQASRHKDWKTMRAILKDYDVAERQAFWKDTHSCDSSVALRRLVQEKCDLS